jgi:hypothetical protein
MEAVVSNEAKVEAKAAPRISLDTWAVLIALAAALLIRVGLIHVNW